MLIRVIFELGQGFYFLNDSFHGYNRLLHNEYLYCGSTNSRKINSSYARLDNNQYIQIMKFLILDTDKSEYTLGKLMNVDENVIDGYGTPKRVVSIDNNVTLVSTNNLLNVCVFMEVDEEFYICDLPNPYSLYT